MNKKQGTQITNQAQRWEEHCPMCGNGTNNVLSKVTGTCGRCSFGWRVGHVYFSGSAKDYEKTNM